MVQEMEEPSPQTVTQVLQPKTPSVLSSYRWRMKGEKAPGSSRWGKLQSWGRALSHPETTEPQPGRSTRSLFRRAFSAPSKELRGGRGLKLPKYWRSASQQQELEPESGPDTKPEAVPEAKATEPTPPAQRIPAAPAPNVPVWDIGGFTLLDGKLLFLRDEEELYGPHTQAANFGSESNLQLGATGSREPERNPGRAEAEPSSTNQFHNVKGLLWKRLKDKKRMKGDSMTGSPGDGDRSSSTQGSRESLVGLGAASELDLSTEQDVQVWPLHPSLLKEPYCFQVSWPGGSRCFSCSSAVERDRWIEDLRRSVQPNQDNHYREETWLSLWVYEAKGLRSSGGAGSAGVHVELWLDGALLARTASLPGPGPHFWAERFHFEALPPARHLSLRLLQAGRPLGAVSLELGELCGSRGALERWFPLSGGPPRAALRVRGRARCLRVLPTERYKELAEFLTFHYPELCQALEPMLPVQAKEELAAAMVRVLHGTGKAQALVTDLGVEELARCGGREALLFRENTLATKAIDEYMKLVGQTYLQEALGEAVRRLCASGDDCEVDPRKCPGPDLPQHQASLRRSCEDVFLSITRSYEWFPAELNTVFSSWREACRARRVEPLAERLVCASLFLRFLCPAILSPSLFGLTYEYPGPGLARTLTLVAKVIQNLANQATFGEKEDYMSFMNDFLEQHGPAMQHFLGQVASGDGNGAPGGCQGSSDLARGLAILHAQLCTIFSDLNQPTRESLEPLPTILRAIEEGQPVPVSVSMGLRSTPNNSSAREKPGFLAPRDLSKHTPLVSKSQSLRSIQGQGQGEEQLPRRPRGGGIQRTQSVPARQASHRPFPVGSRTRPKGSPRPPRKGPSQQGRPWLGTSVSLPRKPSVPWQRHMDKKPQDTDAVLFAQRPQGKLEELQQEVSLLREQQKGLSGQLEALNNHNRTLGEQQEKLLAQLAEESQTQDRQRVTKSETEQGQDDANHRLENLERRLALLERANAELLDMVQRLQDGQKDPGAQLRPPEIPCTNGDAT
ncbi:RAS protein activator like-3 isoform X1 [Ornithorhynchus anatinus]|uniref:RAS protein activator like 3 n=2 Tax=Ornithorhynchus anatinus TaxID=9258 RepID=F6WGI2_ORNAN|nr:RAS protein activator like-3 isoform X1 [Ornithorhynchus anatinus]